MLSQCVNADCIEISLSDVALASLLHPQLILK